MKTHNFSRLLGLQAETFAAVFRMDEMRPRFDSLRDRHLNGTAPRAFSAFQLFQTPPTLAARMVELAEVETWHKVLEPSAGLGRILCNIVAADVTACEIDKGLAGELFQAFPSVTLWQGDFLARDPQPVFDRIVMNPPFHMRADIKHVFHALKFLKPRGKLAGLCLNTRHREEALRPLADFWEVIPSGAFRNEGTQVETALFCITKLKSHPEFLKMATTP